jgi:nitrate reductase gamma subunit
VRFHLSILTLENEQIAIGLTALTIRRYTSSRIYALAERAPLSLLTALLIYTDLGHSMIEYPANCLLRHQHRIASALSALPSGQYFELSAFRRDPDI